MAGRPRAALCVRCACGVETVTDKLSVADGLSIVVPVYNGAATLSELARRLDAVFAGRAFPLELIFVNDGSEDGSWEAIRSLAARFDWISGVDLSRNFGQHNALLCGIRRARYATVVTIDDDLQHPPEEIPKLLAVLRERIDVVYGRPLRHRQSRWRVAASWAVGRLVRMGKQHGAPRFSAFRAFRVQLRDAFADYRAPFVSIDVLLSWSTTRFATVEIEHHRRASGRTGYNLEKLAALALDTFAGFGILRPQHAIWIGLAGLILGGAGLILRLSSATGLATVGVDLADLAALFALFTGLQLCVFGWFGRYVARIHDMATGRPTYVIARTTDGEAGR